tara:strand:- start:7512 stop:7778 length:267 start_codon:yes stop_codon:yes gene_type:complete
MKEANILVDNVNITDKYNDTHLNLILNRTDKTLSFEKKYEIPVIIVVIIIDKKSTKKKDLIKTLDISELKLIKKLTTAYETQTRKENK